MAITDMDSLVAAMVAGERLNFGKDSFTTTNGLIYSFWRVSGQPPAGAIPATGAGAACSNATDGAIPFTNATAPALQYLANMAASGHNVAWYILADRLVHTSGLSAAITTEQTVNSTALTRYTSGEGVEIWLEQYVAVGATARSITVSYTNQAGTAGRTGTGLIGSSAAIGRMQRVQLQAGDTGVRSVQSVTISSTTGAAGDFGITLVKRLFELPGLGVAVGLLADPFDTGLTPIEDDACLFFMGMASTTSMSLLGTALVAKG